MALDGLTGSQRRDANGFLLVSRENYTEAGTRGVLLKGRIRDLHMVSSQPVVFFS